MGMEHRYDKLALDQITVDGGTQTRHALDEDTLAEYAEAMEAGAVFPPVVVFFDGDTRWLSDGFHRYHAAGRAGHTTLLAEQRVGTKRDALFYACSANASHGLRRTNKDKRKAVTTMLEDAEWGGWSNVTIAEHCGVSECLVRSLRPDRSENTQRRYITKHGTEATMNTSRIGRASAHDHQPEPAPEDTTPTREERWETEYPEFAHPSITADGFRHIAETLDAMPPEQRQEYRERWGRRDMNALAKLLGEPDFDSPDPVQVSGYQAADACRGQQEKPDSEEKVAEEVGIAQETLSQMQPRLAAIARYPELGAPDVSQREAIRCWKAWEKLTPAKRTRARKAWRKQQEAQRAWAKAKADRVKNPLVALPPRPIKRRPRRTRSQAIIPPTRPWYVFVAGLQQVITDFEHGGGLVPLFEVWTPEEFERAKQQLAAQMAQLERIARNLEAGQVLKHGTPNLRVVSGQQS
jgi:hypothetical protein